MHLTDNLKTIKAVHLTAVILSLLLLGTLIGCVKDTTTVTVEPTTTESNRETTTTAAPTTTGATSAKEEEPKAYSRLTGLPIDPADQDRRPIAVMINNLRKATPQIGICAADLIIETEVEGGITRLLAVFANTDTIPELGSIRSARHNYIDLANGLDAILVHVGASYAGNDQFALQKQVHIDLGRHSDAYWRDPDWRTNRGMEHSVKTTGERLADLLAGHPNRRNTVNEDLKPLFTFAAPGSVKPADGPAAENIEIPFSRYITASFSYDAEKKVYEKGQFGQPQIDLITDQAISFTNVFILETTIRSFDGGVLREVGLKSGTGYYISGGHYQPVNWQKGDSFAPLIVTDQDGKPLTVNPGKSYLALVQQNRKLKIEP